MSQITLLRNVQVRLADAVRHWFHALRSYSFADDFRVHVNACITTLRQVTFILQSNKDQVPFYATWYEGEKGWQARFRADAVMRWAVDARNTIEKRGDLETNSRLRVTVVASWVVTSGIEFDVCPFLTTEELIGAIDMSCIPSHIREHGLVRAERRWVANSLPEYELLDALAHVVGKLTLMILDGLSMAGEALEGIEFRSPDSTNVTGEKLWSLGGKFPQLRVTQPNRTVWLKLSTGELIEFERTEMAWNKEELNVAQDRYGDIASTFNKSETTPLGQNLSSLAREALRWFELARVIFEKDGFHGPTFIIQDPFGAAQVIQAPMADRSEKYAVIHRIASDIKQFGANRVFAINEMWTALQVPREPFIHAEYRLDRGEALALWAANSDGEVMELFAEIRRDGVPAQLGSTKLATSQVPNFFRPIFDAWGIKLVDPTV